LTSAVGWTFLYLWRGQELLPIVLGEEGTTTAERLDAFAELAALSIAIGLGLGVVARIGASTLRATGLSVLATLDSRLNDDAVADGPKWRRRIEGWLAREIRARSRPGYAWDRLLSRLASRGERVVCRVRTKSGDEVVGVLARGGWLDWEADGRGVLLDKELIRSARGALEAVTASRGLFVPGDEVSTVSVVQLPDAAVLSEEDD